jgi:O-antigen/teichoic acid export membrane protein
MLKWFVGAKEVGIYAVAATLSESWYFVPTAIVASLFPKLIDLKETDQKRFNYRLQQIFEILFVIALSVAVLMSFMGAPLIDLFFGQQYLASAPILAIHIWTALFIFMRAAFSKWILIEDALMFSLITQGFGALTNVGLNLLLIPRYGGYGAAVATLISYAMASYFSLFFYKKSRPVFWMMTKAMLSPVRYPLAYLKLKLS